MPVQESEALVGVRRPGTSPHLGRRSFGAGARHVARRSDADGPARVGAACVAVAKSRQSQNRSRTQLFRPCVAAAHRVTAGLATYLSINPLNMSIEIKMTKRMIPRAATTPATKAGLRVA
jgi:hypothetical protein